MPLSFHQVVLFDKECVCVFVAYKDKCSRNPALCAGLRTRSSKENALEGKGNKLATIWL